MEMRGHVHAEVGTQINQEVFPCPLRQQRHFPSRLSSLAVTCLTFCHNHLKSSPAMTCLTFCHNHFKSSLAMTLIDYLHRVCVAIQEVVPTNGHQVAEVLEDREHACRGGSM
eukprot:1159001-Pelagomonas_calceolata.AAC.4